MKRCSSYFLCCLLACLCMVVQRPARAQFTYSYFPNYTTIDYSVWTDFAIVGYSGGGFDDNFNPSFTGPSSPTVDVVDGADVEAAMVLFNDSTVNASGGFIGFINPVDDSRLNLSGSDSVFVLSTDQAVINMTGGSVQDLEGQGKLIDVRGGTVGTLVANSNTTFFGDELGSCIVNVTGGTFTDPAAAYNRGVLNVYGGNFNGLLVAEGGTINIFGRDLRATLLNSNVGYHFSLYSVSGVLRNGTVWSDQRILVRNDGATYGHSSFTLNNVPGRQAYPPSH